MTAVKLTGAVSFRQQGKAKRARPRQKRERKIVSAVPPVPPTPERIAKGPVELTDVHHYESATRTEAMRFIPWHVTQKERKAITEGEAKIIVKYIDRWLLCEERSPLKSNLNRDKGGGEYNPMKGREAKEEFARWNDAMGKQAANQFVLVCCKELGYLGTAQALYGETATRLDAERIGRRFKKSLKVLDGVMK